MSAAAAASARQGATLIGTTQPDFELLEREVGAGSAHRLLVAALASFSTHGYSATTTRAIALAAGMSPGAVYIHYASKNELLYRLSRIGHKDALRAVRDVTAGEDPTSSLSQRITRLAHWHACHHQLARVSQYELRWLTAGHLAEIRRLRQPVRALIESDISAGTKSGVFLEVETQTAVRAITSLCIDIARWYSPGGARTPDEIGAAYAQLALRMLTQR